MGINTSSPEAESATHGETRLVLDSIRRLVQGLRIASRAAESQIGLSGAQLFVLQKLGDGDDAMSVNDLAVRTCTHQSSVSVVVQRLVEKGLVKRQPAEDDRRRVELSLTPAGRKLIARSPDAAQDSLITAIDSMTPAKRKKLAALLGDLITRIGITAQGPAPMLFEEEHPTKKRPL
ncbi:MAG TPA: MarR family winged helix-turn-helix transcriptional regulator [Tepidisphaeraceae bacterium]|jgi:DNA-binding MarR family transcriptional regulator|nr:MarR family winged helix-turn-helix transcriptional regulator [Tepidisphaeraceae bacterium]